MSTRKTWWDRCTRPKSKLLAQPSALVGGILRARVAQHLPRGDVLAHQHRAERRAGRHALAAQHHLVRPRRQAGDADGLRILPLALTAATPLEREQHRRRNRRGEHDLALPERARLPALDHQRADRAAAVHQRHRAQRRKALFVEAGKGLVAGVDRGARDRHRPQALDGEPGQSLADAHAHHADRGLRIAEGRAQHQLAATVEAAGRLAQVHAAHVDGQHAGDARAQRSEHLAERRGPTGFLGEREHRIEARLAASVHARSSGRVASPDGPGGIASQHRALL